MIGDILQSVPNEQSILKLLKMFDGLLKKYAFLLQYEDAYPDMRLFFVELIISMSKSEITSKEDPQIIKYIATAIKNQYIKLSRKCEKNPLAFSDLSEDQTRYLEKLLSFTDRDRFEDIIPFNGVITTWEYKVLFLIFVENIPVSQIAVSTNKSRQAINQTKVRALSKLRKEVEK